MDDRAAARAPAADAPAESSEAHVPSQGEEETQEVIADISEIPKGQLEEGEEECAVFDDFVDPTDVDWTRCDCVSS